jgi:uncharacterized protein YwqG
MFHTAEDIANDMVAAGIDRVDAEALVAHARPAVWLETCKVDEEGGIPLGATKLGGCPDLPKGHVWPVRSPLQNAAKRAQHYRETAGQADRIWSWATPEQRERFRLNALARALAVESELPLPFVGQINLAEMWACGPLDPDFPRYGLLSLFYDVSEQPWGYDPRDRLGFAVLFHEAERGQLARFEEPVALRTLPEDYRHPPVACTAHACMTPLPMDTAQYTTLDLPETLTDQLRDWWSDGNRLYASEQGQDQDWRCHHVGGWPTPIQGDMQTKCALVHAGHYCGDGKAYEDPALEAVRASATEWLLLAQIGTDNKSNMHWGDDGQLYLWVRRDDAIARRFANAHLVLQCY